MEKVVKTDYCWLWTGAKSSGYGQFWDGTKVIRAHWFLLDQRPKQGQVACHSCDNPSCVNPAHVFIGTQKDNMLDASRKKKWAGWSSEARKKAAARGERAGKATLTDKLAAVIKAVPKKFGRATLLTRHFGLTGMVVGNIWNNRFWTHVVPTARDKAEAMKLLKKLEG